MLAFSAQAEEHSYFSSLPVVASVSRLPQRLADAPTSVTVIDRDMIRNLPIRDLNDVFRLVPGFQTYPNNTEAARVTYHGLTDEEFSPRLQVMVDGRSMYSPAFRNGTNWALIPVAIEDIERIEVVRGTNAVSYGSNAFLGVINIITVDPSVVRGFSVSTSYGNQNVRDYSLRTGGKLGEAGDFRFTYRQQNDDGLRDRFDWTDSYFSRLFDFRADFALTERDNLQVSAGHVDAVTQRGRLKFDNAVLKSDTGNPFRDFEQHNIRLFETVRLAWGGSWRQDAVRAQTTLAGQGDVSRDVARIFGNLEWKPSSWLTGNLGLSGEDDSLAGPHFAPRLSVSFHLDQENTLRFGTSRAYRTGSTVDYKGDWYNGAKYQFRGDPNMPSERMDTLEIGYLGDWRDWRMSLDVRLFNEKVYNRLLVIDRDEGNNAIPDAMTAIQDVRMRALHANPDRSQPDVHRHRCGIHAICFGQYLKFLVEPRQQLREEKQY